MSNPRLRWCGNALIGIGVVLLVWAIGLTLWPKSYSATVRIKAEKEPDSRSRTNKPGFDPYWVQTEFEKIQSKVVLYRVITNLHLAEKWSEHHKSAVDVATAYAMLKRMMDVRQMRNSTLIEIEVRSRDPSEAVAIANEVANVYQAQQGADLVHIVELAKRPAKALFPSARLAIGSWSLALTSIGLGVLMRRN